MKKQYLIFTLIALFSTTQYLKADEGMWLPVLIQQLNIDDMRAKGFKLDANDIYSINKACLKDAVMVFGGGCTGEMISQDGLLLTNHHCGYEQIQEHSSLAHDYLTDGFWAMSRAEELPNPGLEVTFLRSMKEVSSEVLAGVDEHTTEAQRVEIVKKNSAEIVRKATEGTGYVAQVKSFFQDNVYYLLIQEKFSDVRLVGAPPSAVGKFGGDTDNWMWPRHGADFSMFRVYANKDNKPAKYATDNVPYHPAKSLPISLKGIKEGDFTFVLGYPGTTLEYVPALHIEMLSKLVYPQLIDVRNQKLNIINEAMNQSPQVRIQYSAKAASISNAWKKWIGEIKGLDKLDAIHKKQVFENNFTIWAQDKPEYKTILQQYKDLYPKYQTYYFTRSYYREIVGSNSMEFVVFMGTLQAQIEKGIKDKSLDDAKWKALDDQVKMFFKDYNQPTDEKLTEMLLGNAKKHIDAKFLPDMVVRKTPTQLKNKVFKSRFLTPFTLVDYKKNPEAFAKLLKNDPACKLFNAFTSTYNEKVKPQYEDYLNQQNVLNRTYMRAQMAYEKDRKFYPDANFTLRVTYGKVAGYNSEGVHYEPQTFLAGVIKKDNPNIYDYRVPERLKELYLKKDFGPYAQDGDIPVCFIATNHTTGGNSGSPVMNADGELIGLNFDRAWQGVMSDLMYNPDQCRNISVDIRYILFMIDKYAGAGYLINEMDIRK